MKSSANLACIVGQARVNRIQVTYTAIHLLFLQQCRLESGGKDANRGVSYVQVFRSKPREHGWIAEPMGHIVWHRHG